LKEISPSGGYFGVNRDPWKKFGNVFICSIYKQDVEHWCEKFDL